MEQEIQLNAHNKQEYPPMHTCEHIINRTMVNLFGCGRAVSAHIERKKSKLDFALSQAPSEDDIARIETTVNEVIAHHLPVTTEFITQEVGNSFLKTSSYYIFSVRVGRADYCHTLSVSNRTLTADNVVKILY